MTAITFTITAQQPLLMTSFQGDPNSDVSYPYIPGSTLRGALIGRYLRQERQRELDLADDAVYRLFFDDEQTHYLNGYLSDAQGDRTLPLPFSWVRDKSSELSRKERCMVYDLATADLIEAKENLTSPKNIGDGFWREDSGKVQVYRPQKRMNIHTQRDRTKGRATKANGQVFRYESLEAGQSFECAIVCQDADADKLTSLLEVSPSLWIGGSRSAGYGKTTIENIQKQENWQEVGTARPQSSALVVTLLSHTLLRDSLGQPTTDAEAVRAAIANRCPDVTLPAPNPNRTFIKRETIGGFNRKWGLPLPQRTALSAGSVIVFNDVPLSQPQREALELAGIGERRVEGFGRIAINQAIADQPMSVWLAGKPRSEAVTITKTEDAYDIAGKMAERIFEKRLEQALIREAGRIKLAPDHALSNSQLSRLELAAREGLQEHKFKPVKDFLKEENLTKTALRQFQRSQLKKARKNSPQISFYDQLQIWITKDPFAWLNKYTTPTPLDVTITSDIHYRLSEEGVSLATDYTLRLIMAVAKQAKKEKAA